MKVKSKRQAPTIKPTERVVGDVTIERLLDRQTRFHEGKDSRQKTSFLFRTRIDAGPVLLRSPDAAVASTGGAEGRVGGERRRSPRAPSA